MTLLQSMAAFHFLLLFRLCPVLHLLIQFQAQASHLPNFLALPVTKDDVTLQYTTNIQHGTPLGPINLVIDLGAPFLWADCASGPVSSSSRLIPSCSIQCSTAKMAKTTKTTTRSSCCSSQQYSTCDLSPENRITRLATKGELLEDTIAVRSADGSRSTVENFLYSCAPGFLTNGLASGVQGMLGLGRSKIAIPSQFSEKLGFHKKFTICLSSSNGVILFGNVPLDTIFGTTISGSLMYTPLVTSPDGAAGTSQEYFIKVKSIKVNSRRLALNQEGMVTKISTILPYTTLESSIYATFVKGYLKAATSINMTRVGSIAPFDHCFRSEGMLGRTGLGLVVPTIELVLQSEMVKWRVHGRNSMVHVSDEVMCLGFLDGGGKMDPKNPIVIGGYQLEDALVEFDLGTSRLGFSSSLLMGQTSCSNFRLEPVSKESL